MAIVKLDGGYEYKLPKQPANSDILFNNKSRRQQYWVRQGYPTGFTNWSADKQRDWEEEEIERCFFKGCWFYNYGKAIYLTPFFYFMLNWWRVPVSEFSKDGHMEFRYPQLLEEYFECFCEDDEYCVGTYRWKRRREGLTTRRMARMVWKALQVRDSWFGIQSKTNLDAKDVCWKILVYGFKRLPAFLKPLTGGSTDPKTKIEMTRPSMRLTRSNMKDALTDFTDEDLNNTIDYRSTTDNAYDGQECVEIVLDEADKWEGASSIKAYGTYVETITRGSVKKGMIHVFSSPSTEKNDGHGTEFWKMGDYNELKDKKGWKLYRYFTPAHKSFEGAFDRYGYCDEELANKLIDDKINAAKGIMRLITEKQNPRKIEDILNSASGSVFQNAPQLQDRIRELKDCYYIKGTEQPKYIHGNYAWVNGIPDTEVFFKIAADQTNFSEEGRFAVAFDEEEPNRFELRGSKFHLPYDSEKVIGVDPYELRRPDSNKPSKGAACCGHLFDFKGENKDDIGKLPFIYHWRPRSVQDFAEDMIMAAVYHNAFVNSESKQTKLIDHFEDRGYFNFLIPKNDNPDKRDIKGTATNTRTGEDIAQMIEIFNDANLEKNNFEVLLEDNLSFDPANTLKSDLTMAEGMMLIGGGKRRRMYKPKSKTSNNEIAEAILSAFF